MAQYIPLTILFPATFIVVIAYLTSVALLSLRLGALYQADPNRMSRPYFFVRFGREWPYLHRPDPAESLGFLFSSRHRDFGDPMLSKLVWTVRVLLAVGLSMMLAMFTSTFLLAGSAAQ